MSETQNSHSQESGKKLEKESEQKELYQQSILEHNRSPRNFKKLDSCSHYAEGYNPLCGDHFEVFLRLTDDERIEDISFQGQGCAISKSSASLMTLVVKGRTKEEALSIFSDFTSFLQGKIHVLPSDDQRVKKLQVFSSVWKFPARVKCAALSWHALKGALLSEKIVSTE